MSDFVVLDLVSGDFCEEVSEMTCFVVYWELNLN